MTAAVCYSLHSYPGWQALPTCLADATSSSQGCDQHAETAHKMNCVGSRPAPVPFSITAISRFLLPASTTSINALMASLTVPEPSVSS